MKVKVMAEVKVCQTVGDLIAEFQALPVDATIAGIEYFNRDCWRVIWEEDR